jgi:hypothetical protein
MRTFILSYSAHSSAFYDMLLIVRQLNVHMRMTVFTVNLYGFDGLLCYVRNFLNHFVSGSGS